jgi:hypothetical protein
MEVPGCKSEHQRKLRQMSAAGTQPAAMPNPTKVVNRCMWLWCEGAAGCTRCCAMSAALAPSSCNQGFGRCAHQLSERAHASSPCLYIKHKPLQAFSACLLIPLDLRIHLRVFQSRNGLIAGCKCLQSRPVSYTVDVLLSHPRSLFNLLHMLVPPLALQTRLSP